MKAGLDIKTAVFDIPHGYLSCQSTCLRVYQEWKRFTDYGIRESLS